MTFPNYDPWVDFMLFAKLFVLKLFPLYSRSSLRVANAFKKKEGEKEIKIETLPSSFRWLL